MRLPIAILAAFFTFAGIAIAAPCFHYQTHWIGPIFGFGVLSIGTQMGANLATTYALDSHREMAGEVMVTISATKSAIAWSFSWFINDWIVKNGMMNVFFTSKSLCCSRWLKERKLRMFSCCIGRCCLCFDFLDVLQGESCENHDWREEMVWAARIGLKVQAWRRHLIA